MKNALLIIDPQNDFATPTGSLFVNGSVEDTERIAAFIDKNAETLENITVSLDWHQPFSIFHPSFWRDANGNQIEPFTEITAADVKEGKYIPQVAKVTVETYLQELEDSGEYGHFIWPEHCIAGTSGAAIVDVIAKAMQKWSNETQREYKTILKGENILTEFFGVFKAQVALPGFPDTDWNTDAINGFKKYDKVYIAGEAKSHCVAQTVKQLLQFPEIRKKLVILEDCMSNVTGFETIADPIWSLAKSLGVEFINSTDI